MWTYVQSTGELFDADGHCCAVGYSGYDHGKNNPELQTVHNVGPIPEGIYTIGAPRDSVAHGPYVLSLTPDHATDTFGRSGFLCHGDSIHLPGKASLGCIIMPRVVREQLWERNDHFLKVISAREETQYA